MRMRMARRKQYPEKQVAAFPAGTFDRIDALRDPEITDRTDIYREAIEQWLQREERKAQREKGHSDDAKKGPVE